MHGLGMPPARVAVFRGLSGVGDFLVSVPALRLLRESLPKARLALISPEEVRPLAERFSHLFDEFVSLPGCRGSAETIPEADARRLEPWLGCDAIIQMDGTGSRANQFCLSLGAQTLVCCGPSARPVGHVVDIAPYARVIPEVDRCFDLATRTIQMLGADLAPVDRDLEFRMSTEDIRQAAEVLLGRWRSWSATDCVAMPYFIVHPGAHPEGRRWPIECFAEVGRVLARAADILVTGTEAEAETAEKTAALIGGRARSVAGRLGLGSLAVVIAEARGIVTNDSGVSHIADAVMTPSVIIFTASDPNRWAPRDRALHVPVVQPARNEEPGYVTPEGVRLGMPSVSAVLEGLRVAGMAELEGIGTFYSEAMAAKAM